MIFIFGKESSFKKKKKKTLDGDETNLQIFHI